MLGRRVLVASLLIGLAALHSQLANALSQRNPFGVPDIVGADSPEIMRLASRVEMPGGPDDRNAPQWSQSVARGSADSFDGEWYSRWEDGTFGTAKIRVIDDRLFALFTNKTGRMAGRTWLLEAVIGGDKRLAGRWVQVGNARDTGPFIGLIVDSERIDGIWSPLMNNRWDFRRQLSN